MAGRKFGRPGQRIRGHEPAFTKKNVPGRPCVIVNPAERLRPGMVSISIFLEVGELLRTNQCLWGYATSKRGAEP